MSYVPGTSKSTVSVATSPALEFAVTVSWCEPDLRSGREILLLRSPIVENGIAIQLLITLAEVKLTYLCWPIIDSAGQSFQYATSLAAHYVDCELCHFSCALDGEWRCMDKCRHIRTT